MSDDNGGVLVDVAEESPGWWMCRAEYRNLLTQGQGNTEPGAVAAALTKLARAIRKNDWHKRTPLPRINTDK